MPMIELPKAHEGGTFWINSDRIIAMQEGNGYGRYTTIRTDDGTLHSTSLEAKQVNQRIVEATE